MANKELTYVLNLSDKEFIKKLDKAGIKVGNLTKVLNETKNTGNNSFLSLKKNFVGLTFAINQGLDLFIRITEQIGDILEFTKDLNNSINRVKNTFNVANIEAKELTANIKAMGKTLDVDFNQRLKASRAFLNEFKLTAEETTSLLDKAITKAPDDIDELLEIVREYSSQINQIGVTANQFLAISVQALNQGVYSDKGIDAIKEFNIRFRELNTSAIEALNNIGINAEEQLSLVETGQKNVYDVLLLVSQELNKLGINSQETGKVLADVFGGAGEDAGQFLLRLNNLTSNLDNIESKLSASQESQLNFNRALENFKYYYFGEMSNYLASASDYLTNILELITPVNTEVDKVNDNFRSQREELEKLTTLYFSLRGSDRSEQGQSVYLETIKELQNLYPNHLKNLDLEKASYREIQEALKGINAELETKLEKSLLRAERADLVKRRFNLSREIKEDIREKVEDTEYYKDFKKDFDDYKKRSLGTLIYKWSAYFFDDAFIEKKLDELKEIENAIKDLDQEYKDFFQESDKEEKENTRLESLKSEKIKLEKQVQVLEFKAGQEQKKIDDIKGNKENKALRARLEQLKKELEELKRKKGELVYQKTKKIDVEKAENLMMTPNQKFVNKKQQEMEFLTNIRDKYFKNDIENYTRYSNKIKEIQKEINQQETTENLVNNQKKLEEWKEQNEALILTVNAVGDAFYNLGNNVIDSLFDSTKKASEILKDFLKDVVKMTFNALLKMAVMKGVFAVLDLFSSGLFGGAKDLAGGATGAGTNLGINSNFLDTGIVAGMANIDKLNTNMPFLNNNNTGLRSNLDSYNNVTNIYLDGELIATSTNKINNNKISNGANLTENI